MLAYLLPPRYHHHQPSGSSNMDILSCPMPQWNCVRTWHTMWSLVWMMSGIHIQTGGCYSMISGSCGKPQGGYGIFYSGQWEDSFTCFQGPWTHMPLLTIPLVTAQLYHLVTKGDINSLPVAVDFSSLSSSRKHLPSSYFRHAVASLLETQTLYRL